MGRNLESAAPSLPTRGRTPGRGPPRVGKASTRAPASRSPQEPHQGEAVSVYRLWEDSHQLPGQRSPVRPPWGEPTQTWVVWENLPQQRPLMLGEDFRCSQCEKSSIKNSTLTCHQGTHNTRIPGRKRCAVSYRKAHRSHPWAHMHSWSCPLLVQNWLILAEQQSDSKMWKIRSV